MPTHRSALSRLAAAKAALTPAALQDRSDAGLTRDNPAPLGVPVDAGPIRMAVASVLSGPDAVAAVLAASPLNVAPREGVDYVLVTLSATNTSERPLHLGNDDFGLVGSDGVVRRFLDVTLPAPALDGFIEPGATAEGLLVFAAAAGDPAPVLLADPLFLDGDWADRYLALAAGAVPPAAAPPLPVNDAGRDPALPALPGEAVTTADWSLVLEEIVRGAAVFDIVDYRTGALRIEDATGVDGSEWVALRFSITRNAAGGPPATFPGNAFQLADAAGSVILDMPVLTPPRPDAVGEYFPGATRAGWVAFDVPWDLEPVLFRFQPYPATTRNLDPRYFPAAY